MTHAAKRIGHGHYQYRGHIIIRVDMDALGCTPASTRWDVYLDDKLVDSAHTLRDAKLGTDEWIAR